MSGLRLLCALVCLASLVKTTSCSRRTEAPTQRSGAGVDTTLSTRQLIAWLEAERSFGGERLFAAARHPDPRVRRATAMALGRIQDASAAPVLIDLVRDEDKGVSIQAVWGLRQLQGLDEAGHRRVQLALVEEIEANPLGPDVWRLLEALVPHAGPESVPLAIERLGIGMRASLGGIPPALPEGMAALVAAKVRNSVARQALAKFKSLADRESDSAWRLAEALSSPPDSSCFAPVLSLLKNPAPEARAVAARVLAKFGQAEAAEPLQGLLADSEWEVRAAALATLGSLRDPRSLPYCAALVGDAHPLVREAALGAMLAFDKPGHQPIVHAALDDPVAAVRLAALRVVAKSESTTALGAWTRARRDSLDFVRAEVLEQARDFLGAAVARDTLLELLRSGPARQRAEAALALGDLTLPTTEARRAEMRAALVDALDDSDFVVATQAAESLGKLGFAEAAEPLQNAYRKRNRDHYDIDVRLATVTAIAALAKAHPTDETLGHVLDDASRDPDRRVAHEARVGLARLRGKEPPEMPAPRAGPAPPPPATLPRIDLGLVLVRLSTRHGDAILELDGDRFPRTVGHVLSLIDSGFYEDAVFHRVVPAFVVQGGCPRGDGWGDSGSTIPCEYGDLRYDRAGVVGMAHAGKDTGGSQFFITHLPVLRLDGRYTAFGHVIEGMDVVDEIVRGDRFRLERIELHSERH